MDGRHGAARVSRRDCRPDRAVIDMTKNRGRGERDATAARHNEQATAKPHGQQVSALMAASLRVGHGEKRQGVMLSRRGGDGVR